jgi:hypothetical protein
MNVRSRNRVRISGRPGAPVVVLAHGFGCDQNGVHLGCGLPSGDQLGDGGQVVEFGGGTEGLDELDGEPSSGHGHQSKVIGWILSGAQIGQFGVGGRAVHT